MKQALALVLLGIFALGLFFLLRGPASTERTSAAVSPIETNRKADSFEAADLALSEEGQPTVVTSPEDSDREAVPQEVAAEPDASVKTTNKGVVFGRCIDAHELPLSGVSITGRGVPDNSLTAGDGSFRLDIDLGQTIERTNRLVFSFDGLGVERLQPVVRAGGEQDLGDIVLLTAATLSGRVIDAEGNGIEGAGVRLQKSGELSHGSRFQGPTGDFVETSAGADGSFLLSGVPAGGLELWAGKEGWFWTHTKILVDAGSRHEGLELVIAPLAPEDTIEFIVVDPEGTPVPHADINYRYRTSGRSGSGSTQANADGSFRHFLDVRADYSFQAQDPERRFQPAIMRDIKPGTRGLVLQLGPRRTALLNVASSDGDAVEVFRAATSLVDLDFGTTHVPPGNDTLPLGQVEIVVPPEEFELTITAEGFEVARLGPFTPDAVPAELHASLVPLPGIHGRVLSADGPVSGAKVALHEYVGDVELTVNGFPCVSKRWSESSTESGPDGTFFLTLRESGSWVIRAQAPGFAPAVTEPGHLEASVGAQDVDLFLGQGGAIEGRVLLPPGEERSGRLIGLSRGDGFGFTGRTDASGRFRFERLTPGPWQVVGRTEEIRSGSTTSSSGSGKRDPIPWDCHVQEGRTTHFDVDLRDVQQATLEGTLLLGGKAPTDWFISLDSQEPNGPSQASGRVDPNGKFSLTVNGTGKFRLTFMGRIGATYVSGLAYIELVLGRNEFLADVPVGRLVVRVLPELFPEDSRLVVVSKSRDDIEFRAFLNATESGTIELNQFPAGSARIDYRTASGEEGQREVEVPRDDLLEVSVP